MKKVVLRSAAVLTAALLAISSSSITAFAASSADDSSVVSLKKEIARLRKENAMLRKEHVPPAQPSASAPEAQRAMATALPLKSPPARSAPRAVSGYVEVYSGGAWAVDSPQSPFFTSDFKYHDGWVLGGAGRANWWATQNISTQFDIQAEGTRYATPSNLLARGFSGHFSTLSYLGGAHVNWRDPAVGLAGLFGGIGDAGGNILTVGNEGIRHGVIGAEGQAYLSALTLYAQGGYDATISNGNVALFDDIHAWFVRGTGRYFVTPNFMLEGTAQYAHGSFGYNFVPSIPGNNFNMWVWGIKAEWKPETLPFSLFATYQGSRTNYDNNVFFGTTSERVTENRVMAGLRLYLGQDTLLANDRTGATLDIIDPLGRSTSPAMLFPNGQVIFVSDARLKRDIALVARRPDGLGLYRYRYLWSDTIYVGVMAQEVALIHPEAVVRSALDGYLRVDYGRLGAHLMTLPEWKARSGAEKL